VAAQFKLPYLRRVCEFMVAATCLICVVLPLTTRMEWSLFISGLAVFLWRPTYLEALAILLISSPATTSRFPCG
jgi:hypothetical protein